MRPEIPFTKSRKNGFTLIELLVAMSISSVLLIILAALITQTTDGYALSQRSVNHLAQTRAFLQLFETELSIRLPDTPVIHHSSVLIGSEGSDQIAFVRTLPKDEQTPEHPGDLATSCYYVAFTEDSDQRSNPKLFRKILNPTETQKLMDAGREADIPEVDPILDEPVIDYVLSFQATPMYRNPETGNDEPWDRTITINPSHIELLIRTLDDSLSRRFTNQPAWNRLATSPTDSELEMIRSVSHKVSIGK